MPDLLLAPYFVCCSDFRRLWASVVINVRLPTQSLLNRNPRPTSRHDDESDILCRQPRLFVQFKQAIYHSQKSY